MITINNATLHIQTVSGRYGEFNVGSIESTVGIFSLNNDLIESIEEGTYQGVDIDVSQFQLRDYLTRSGKKVVEINVDVLDIRFNNDSIEDNDDDIFDITSPLNTSEASKVDVEATDTDNPEESVFSADLLPLGEVVKLDPTVGRTKLREQTSVLKEKGYRFIPSEQVWKLSSK